MKKVKLYKCEDCGEKKPWRGLAHWDIEGMTEDDDGTDVFFCHICSTLFEKDGMDCAERKESKRIQEKKIKCNRRGCKNIATRSRDWFSLTNEYKKNAPTIYLCEDCLAGIEFDQEIRKQMAEYD